MEQERAPRARPRLRQLLGGQHTERESDVDGVPRQQFARAPRSVISPNPTCST
ncbi:hypothetical protein [Streptomyces sp. NPDC048825]|uniref:hypothetical protein n=1 Tax=Streptomyces sp. NPDC048825 TaxID=3365592 RepID=UPI00372142BB